jgi:hypothetical protein
MLSIDELRTRGLEQRLGVPGQEGFEIGSAASAYSVTRTPGTVLIASIRSEPSGAWISFHTLGSTLFAFPYRNLPVQSETRQLRLQIGWDDQGHGRVGSREPNSPGAPAPDADRMELAGNGDVAGGQEPSTLAAVAVQPTAFGRDTRPRLIKLATRPCAHVT